MRRGRLSFPLSRPACCVLLFGLVFSFALFLWIGRQEQDTAQANFERRAQFRVVALEQGMNNPIDALQVVNQLFVVNDKVSREQFHAFTQPLLARYPHIDAFSVTRLVSRQERPAFEARMRTRFPNFAIHDMVGGQRAIAAERDHYRVVDYIEPMAGKKTTLGLDVSTQSFQDDAVVRARDTGLPAASGLFQLVRDVGAQRGIRILMAVYEGGAVPGTVAARRRALVGYTVATLRADVLVDQILTSAGRLGNAGLAIRVYAAASADESKQIFGQTSSTLQPVWSFGKPLRPFIHTFNVAGASWHLVIATRPMPFIAAHGTALMVLMFNLLGTLAATAWLRSLSLRAQRIEQLVARRTDQLEQANQALRKSEQRAIDLADVSSDWYWEQDEQFRYTRCSIGMLGTGGLSSHLILGATRWEVPVDLQASDWPAHRAQMEAHQPFRNFEFKILADGVPARWFSASGKPLFHADGHFKGYQGTCKNITVRKAAVEALQHSRRELRKLADHQAIVREEERKRIARDIHDDLGQNLLVLKMDVATLHARTGAAHPKLHGRVTLVLNNIDATIQSLKSIMNDLRPATLELGLCPALEWQIKQFERISGIACTLTAPDVELDLNEGTTSAIFRIVQESLSNVARHAEASTVAITLSCDLRGLSVHIMDDGKGLQSGDKRKIDSFGLLGIRERLHALGGEFTITSSPGNGTVLSIFVPTGMPIS